MFSDRELAEAMYGAHESKSIKKGSDAFFVFLNDCFGVKSFYNRYVATQNQNFQYLASLHSIAPRCLGTIHHLMCPKTGREVFSFVTEVADTSAFEDVAHIDDNDYWDFVDIMESSCEYRRLVKKMRDCGFGAAVHDLHPGNVGHYRGELVCIDFSRMEAAGFRSCSMLR